MENEDDIIRIPEGREEEFLPRSVCNALRELFENEELLSELENGSRIFAIELDKSGNIKSSRIIEESELEDDKN